VHEEFRIRGAGAPFGPLAPHHVSMRMAEPRDPYATSPNVLPLPTMLDNGFSSSSNIILPGRNYGWPVVTFRRDTPASLSEQPYTRRHGVPDIECRIRGARVVSRAFQVNLRLT
jgi:hypothetical protein